MMTDPIADMLTRIRNASSVKKSEVVFPYSKLKFTIVGIFKKEGYILSAQRGTSKTSQHDEIRITLKYKNGGKESVIHAVNRVSAPGRRLYIKYRDMNSAINRRGIAVISTPQGIMTNKEAYKQKIGGEIICEIY